MSKKRPPLEAIIGIGMLAFLAWLVMRGVAL